MGRAACVWKCCHMGASCLNPLQEDIERRKQPHFSYYGNSTWQQAKCIVGNKEAAALASEKNLIWGFSNALAGYLKAPYPSPVPCTLPSPTWTLIASKGGVEEC